MHCIVTTNGYTEHEDFSQADLAVSELGDSPDIQVNMETLKKIIADDKTK